MKKYYHEEFLIGKDLSVGYKDFLSRDPEVREHLDALLKVILDLKRKNHPALKQLNVITWRGAMTTVLCTPFYRREAWELAVTKYKVPNSDFYYYYSDFFEF
jgi:RAT1-interacting protein